MNSAPDDPYEPGYMYDRCLLFCNGVEEGEGEREGEGDRLTETERETEREREIDRQREREHEPYEPGYMIGAFLLLWCEVSIRVRVTKLEEKS